ncbi:hypothetical protein F5876DRAFT_71068 [Lentinula aff. lateritia]|uniref:Uncharacterized protein n=1 Tax=Lentinula aff. lateritia TaxID=2804960 RepID=A0ACC1TH16_9AGAR|nr:hypothetical protein F5876DRAFT_71068 [Lentinula aff. lateritia]
MLILPLLHYHHLVPFFFLLTFVARDYVLALPAGNYSMSLSLREAISPASDELTVGYRYVSREKADEYNKAGTLTAIPATTKSIGEGAYLSPRLGEFPGNPDQSYWEVMSHLHKILVVRNIEKGSLLFAQCIVFGKKSKILDTQTPKLFVDDKAAISFKRFKLLLYANKRGYELGKTLLFSRHFMLQDNIQMLIPPMFLIKSPSNPSRPAGANSLGLRIHCTPLGGLGKNRPAADWLGWKIHDWPASITKT